MKYTSISKAREQLRLMGETKEEVMVLRDNEPVAVMMPMDHYEALRALAVFASDAEREVQMEQLHAQTMAGTVDAGDIADYERHRDGHEQATIAQE